MVRIVTCAFVAMIFSLGVQAQSRAAPSIALWRLDCGSFNTPLNSFSDTEAYPGQRRTFTDSCYLIRHGKDYLLFDTGFASSLKGPLDPSKPISLMGSTPITQQIAALGLKASDISIVALSHNHSDHTGQAADFPRATLLIGQADFDALRSLPAPFFTEPDQLRPWLSGVSHLDSVAGDRDIFGDGSVIFVALPGHTAGHHGLLVRLRDFGPVLISADAVHFQAQLDHGVPPSNANRADTLASIDRLQRLINNLHATLIIPHDPDFLDKLPKFPNYAH
jgi:N-acyl homoserine lactone hydrolase